MKNEDVTFQYVYVKTTDAQKLLNFYKFRFLYIKRFDNSRMCWIQIKLYDLRWFHLNIGRRFRLQTRKVVDIPTSFDFCAMCAYVISRIKTTPVVLIQNSTRARSKLVLGYSICYNKSINQGLIQYTYRFNILSRWRISRFVYLA